MGLSTTYTKTETDFLIQQLEKKLEGENVAQYDLINDLSSDIEAERTRNDVQDEALENLEGENASQNDLIKDLFSELQSEKTRNDIQDSTLNNLEGIYYTWSPTNRTLTLFDRGGNQLSQVSLVSLDNEGTDLRYNASTLSLELYNADNELLDSIPVSSFIGSVGTQLQLNSNQLQLRDSQGNVLSTVSFSIVNISGLQTALDSRLNKGSYPGNASDLKTEIDGKANTSHTHPISEVTNLQTTLDNKVDKVIGKQLSTEDYTTAEKNKLAGIQEGAEVNVNADWNATSGDAQILNKPSTFTPSAHTHPISQVDNLQTTLDGKESKISAGTTGQYWRGDKTWQTLNKSAVGLSNVDNTSDANKPISNATQSALNAKADLVDGKIPASQLPAYVDDVLEFANLASFPATGENGKIYIAIDTNLTYRWGGSSYVVMSSSLALGETSSTAYRGDRGKIAYDHSQTIGNPHGTTKNDIGLGNVPNLDTTNAVNNSHTHSNKSILDLITEPFTTSLKSLYDGVVTSINNLLLTGQRLITSGEITKLSNTSGTNTGDETTSSIQTKRPLKTIEGKSLEGSGNIDLTKNDIGLSNVDNTSDLNKPISTATQTALDLKEKVANKATDLSSPDNTKYPTTLAVANENKKATITVELISQLTTNFYAPNALRINSTALISGSGTITLKVNDVAYTLGNLIPQGAKITAETTSQSVYNLISIYE